VAIPSLQKLVYFDEKQRAFDWHYCVSYHFQRKLSRKMKQESNKRKQQERTTKSPSPL
jgi:hypothetical protein